MPNHACWIVGAGPLQCMLIDEAKRLGLSTVVTDGNMHAPGMARADIDLVCSTYDVAGHVAMAQSPALRAALVGVCTAGADVAPTVAAVAQACGVRGIPVEVARRTHDKSAVRAALHAAGLQRYQPRWMTCSAQYDGSVYGIGGYPVVVKPLSQRASRGVTIVHEARHLPAALETAAQYGDAVLIEELLTGTEHSIEGIFDDAGDLVWFNIVDRPFMYDNGVTLELGHINPSNLLTPEDWRDCRIMFCAAAQALGVTWGPFKIDALMQYEGPKILECTARLSGGYDCQGTSPLTLRSPLRTLLQVACGLPVERYESAHGYAACAAILPERTGRLERIDAPETPTAIREVIWNVQPGDAIAPAQHNAQRSGFVLAHDNHSANAAWRAARGYAQALADAMVIREGE